MLNHSIKFWCTSLGKKVRTIVPNNNYNIARTIVPNNNYNIDRGNESKVKTEESSRIIDNC